MHQSSHTSTAEHSKKDFIMSNTVQFQNAYVEVLFDNFVSVVKQNVYVQAQNKVAEEAALRGEEMQTQAINLAETNTNLQNEVEVLNKTITDLNDRLKAKEISILQQSSTISQGDVVLKDKNRLQSAVNDYMRQIKKLDMDNKMLIEENEKLKFNINALIAIAPTNKVKRLGIAIPKNNEINTVEDAQVEETNVLEEVKNGGTF